MKYNILEGDCFELIKNQPDNSVDLVITSPPYSDIVNYGRKVSTKKPDDYVDWILPLFNEIYRVLKPSGSFILNINDKCEGGYRSTYIYDLISRNNKETKLKLYDTYIWYKLNGIPNGGVKRFRNTTEFIFHFCKNNKEMKFHMNKVLEEPKNTIKNKTKRKRSGYILKDDGTTERIGFYEPIPNIEKEPDKVRPDNVVRFSTAASSRDNLIKHPAPYHKDLPLYYINLLTDEGDLVLDPFSGIATTGIACRELDREYIGYELNESYAEFSIKRLEGILDDEYVVSQYTLDDELVKSYRNYSQASKETGINQYDIMRAYNREVKSYNAGGYKWKLEKV